MLNKQKYLLLHQLALQRKFIHFLFIFLRFFLVPIACGFHPITPRHTAHLRFYQIHFLLLFFLDNFFLLLWLCSGLIQVKFQTTSQILAKTVLRIKNLKPLDIFLSSKNAFFAQTKKASPDQCLRQDNGSQDLPHGQDFLQCLTEPSV